MKARIYYKGSNGRGKKIMFRGLGIVSIGLGLLLIFYFFFPIVSYHFFLREAFATGDSHIEVPIPKYDVADDSDSPNVIAAGIDAITKDFTDARTWYPGVQTSINKSTTSQYFISIPSVKVENAIVSTTDYDLASHLVQYYGTMTPPKKGSTVIYGHSTLPQLFDAKNYKTIFAHLHTVDLGDNVIVNIDGNKYTYKIFQKTITTPDDTSIFTQNYDDSYLTLVTCTPPGTTWKRLVVRAKMEETQDGQ